MPEKIGPCYCSPSDSDGLQEQGPIFSGIFLCKIHVYLPGSALPLRVVPAWFSVVQRGSGRFSHQGAIKLCGDLSKNHNNGAWFRATDYPHYNIRREYDVGRVGWRGFFLLEF